MYKSIQFLLKYSNIQTRTLLAYTSHVRVHMYAIENTNTYTRNFSMSSFLLNIQAFKRIHAYMCVRTPIRGMSIWAPPFGRRQLGARQLGAGNLGSVSQFYFSRYEEKTIKQAIPCMPLSANLLAN